MTSKAWSQLFLGLAVANALAVGGSMPKTNAALCVMCLCLAVYEWRKP